MLGVLMTYLIKYLFQIKQDLNVMINVIQINGGITMNVVLSIKTSYMWKGYYEKYYENGE